MDVRFDSIGPVNRFINWTYSGRKPRILRSVVSILFHVELPVLSSPLRMGHPYGIIISDETRLGRNVTVFQGVTIGSKRIGDRAGSPTICDDVVVFPNAVIVGRIAIGAGATVAPGAVVIHDVPPGVTVAGNPARPVLTGHRTAK